MLSVVARSSTTSDSLAPPPSPYPLVNPSPTNSSGTENTDIEEDIQEQVENNLHGATVQFSRPQSRESLIIAQGLINLRQLVKLDTTVASRSRSGSDEAPSSVIHVPLGFRELVSATTYASSMGLLTRFYQDISSRLASESSRQVSSRDSISPSTPDAALGPEDRRLSSVSPPLNTDIPLEKAIDRPTPRAQTRQEVEDEWKRRSRRTSSLEGLSTSESLCARMVLTRKDIPETITVINKTAGDSQSRSDSADETSELRCALDECWMLCRTLSNLSSNHRQRARAGSRSDAQHEQAWRSCWYLCKQLYESYNNRSHIQQILETCREFCQALFDVRLRDDESVDSILRVSFELNNHLYNTHDRHLPEAFKERTLEFYVTLCHRMMKRSTSLTQNNDALLRACWALAEALFNLRHMGRDAKTLDELLASAIQACWDLSDIFREGWSHLQPDKSTPRPGQAGFSSSVSKHSTGRSDRAPSSLSSEYHDAPLPPETPTTIFDDATTVSSPESVTVPNILVLGPAAPASSGGSTRGTKHHDRWSSNASTLSDHSESADSQHTSSTARANTDGKHLLRLRCLILKAALNVGFSRTSNHSLASFVKSLPANTFGNQSWQVQLFEHYKRLVTVDQSLRSITSLSDRSLTAVEIAKAVMWLSRNEDWVWLQHLYLVVFDFGVQEAEVRGGFLQI
ncbi:hypothetical protein E4T49_07651 [Aureobasidium sp. EXF-10728]|nr:hypothetical protein E4T49_07651 [Aureobasidium sp. EXF-10728]